MQRTSFHHGALHIVLRMLHGQANKAPPGFRVKIRGALALQVGQIDEPPRAHRRFGRILVDKFKDIFARLFGELRLFGAKIIPHPGDRAAKRVHRARHGNLVRIVDIAPDFIALLFIQHVRRDIERCARRSAQVEARLSQCSPAYARHAAIHAARDDRRPLSKARSLGRLFCNISRDLNAADDLREHGVVKPAGLDHLPIPLLGAVVIGHIAAGIRIIRAHPPRQLIDDDVLRRQHFIRLAVNFRLVLLHPHHLGDGIGRRGLMPGNFIASFCPNALLQLLLLSVGTHIAPQDRAIQEVSLLIQAGAAMPHAAKRDRGDIFWVNFRHQLPGSLADCPPPVARVLLAHAVIPVKSLIGGDHTVQHLAILLEQGDFVPARPKIMRQ